MSNIFRYFRLIYFGFAQQILKVIYLLSVWSRTYPGLHPHWTWPSELIQTCSHPPFSFLHSSAVKSEKWISKKECVFFTILVKYFGFIWYCITLQLLLHLYRCMFWKVLRLPIGIHMGKDNEHFQIR